MHWLLVGYMFLFIHRPFEIYPILGDFYLERIYMLGLMGFWAVFARKRLPLNVLHLAYFLFAAGVLFSWMLSPWIDKGQLVVENWFKIVVFYTLLVTGISDPKRLRQLCFGFVMVMFVYMLHSLKEYVGGRHTYRMGISRMIGVDSSLGDPNSFGGSIVYALPFVTLFWHHARGLWQRAFVAGYFSLSVLCILLTGSRSSFLGMLIWMAWVVLTSRHRLLALVACVILSPVVFLALPDSLQNRFETIINPDVGPENARVSGEGRLEGLIRGGELFMANPLSGCGPGAWRPATGSDIESHSLYGQLAGELGLPGVIGFVAILVGFFWNWLRLRRYRKRDANPDDFAYGLANAVMFGIFLLLVEGVFGHNLFRHNWLWYGGFLVIARAGVEARLRSQRRVSLTDAAIPSRFIRAGDRPGRPLIGQPRGPRF